MLKLYVYGLLISCLWSCKVTGPSSPSQSANTDKSGYTSSSSSRSSREYANPVIADKTSSVNTTSAVISEEADKSSYTIVSSTDNSEPGEVSFGKSKSKATTSTKSTYSSGGTGSTEYRIQLAAMNNLNGNAKFPVSNVSTRIDNNKMIYEIGGYTNANEAFNYAQTLRKKKVVGAFVTKFVNSVRDYSYDFLKDGDRTSSYSTSSSTAPVKTSSSYTGYSSSQTYTTTPKNVIEVVEPVKSAGTKSTKLVIED